MIRKIWLLVIICFCFTSVSSQEQEIIVEGVFIEKYTERRTLKFKLELFKFLNGKSVYRDDYQFRINTILSGEIKNSVNINYTSDMEINVFLIGKAVFHPVDQKCKIRLKKFPNINQYYCDEIIHEKTKALLKNDLDKFDSQLKTIIRLINDCNYQETIDSIESYTLDNKYQKEIKDYRFLYQLAALTSCKDPIGLKTEVCAYPVGMVPYTNKMDLGEYATRYLWKRLPKLIKTKYDQVHEKYHELLNMDSFIDKSELVNAQPNKVKLNYKNYYSENRDQYKTIFKRNESKKLFYFGPKVSNILEKYLRVDNFGVPHTITRSDSIYEFFKFYKVEDLNSDYDKGVIGYFKVNSDTILSVNEIYAYELEHKNSPLILVKNDTVKGVKSYEAEFKSEPRTDIINHLRENNKIFFVFDKSDKSKDLSKIYIYQMNENGDYFELSNTEFSCHRCSISEIDVVKMGNNILLQIMSREDNEHLLRYMIFDLRKNKFIRTEQVSTCVDSRVEPLSTADGFIISWYDCSDIQRSLKSLFVDLHKENEIKDIFVYDERQCTHSPVIAMKLEENIITYNFSSKNSFIESKVNVRELTIANNR